MRKTTNLTFAWMGTVAIAAAVCTGGCAPDDGEDRAASIDALTDDGGEPGRAPASSLLRCRGYSTQTADVAVATRLHPQTHAPELLLEATVNGSARRGALVSVEVRQGSTGSLLALDLVEAGERRAQLVLFLRRNAEQKVDLVLYQREGTPEGAGDAVSAICDGDDSTADHERFLASYETVAGRDAAALLRQRLGLRPAGTR